MNRIRRLGTLLALALLASSAIVAGQQETATITGEVRDASGGLIPKAAITVTNTSTNISIKGESNDSGLYTLVSLRPGLYSVSVEKDGFKRLVRPAITLQVNQVVRLDFTLEVGELSATVEVTTATQLIESQTSARGAVIEQKKILEDMKKATPIRPRVIQPRQLELKLKIQRN